ncbi:hypothetical protein H0H93_001156 [Arthromyces matolae]|nr:hypothetical protein H0H93_001156 [Arthromyces matolae]
MTAGVVQLGLQWALFTLVFFLYMLYYPIHLKSIESPDAPDTQLLHVKTPIMSPEWRLSIVLAWATAIHMAFITFTTFFLLLTVPTSPAPDVPLPEILARWATFLGVSSALLAAIQYAPQLIHTYKAKIVGALSIPMMCIQSPGAVLMVLSIALRPGTNWTSWITFAVSGVMQGSLLAMCIVFHFRQHRLGLDEFGNPLSGQREDVDTVVPGFLTTDEEDPRVVGVALVRAAPQSATGSDIRVPQGEEPTEATPLLGSGKEIARATSETAEHCDLSNELKPQASFTDSLPTRSDSFVPQIPSSVNILPDDSHASETNVDEKSLPVAARKRRYLVTILGAIAVAVVVLAIILPIYLVVIRNSGSSRTQLIPAPGPASGTSTSTTGRPSATPQVTVTSGGDGSVVTKEDGSTFTYVNKFGGFWVSDPDSPFESYAQPNSWTPPLNASWTWGKDRIHGVNLGGLFVLEPFISPALFQKYPGAVDEWTLSTLMRADTANGGINQLEDHYNTFITEEDIAQIAGAGLNWIRLPVPFWAIEVWPGEPFLEKTSWKYIERLFGWCRKYGIRIMLDLHTIPGSQNAYNHSGKSGKVNFLNGVMGIANAQRALEYIRVFTEFISQKQFKDLVPVFGIVNEALLSTIGRAQLTSFYLEAHTMIRNITGIGEGNGPYIAFHDGFQGLASWQNSFPGADRMILDVHPYITFDGGAHTDPVDTGMGAQAGGIYPQLACDRFGGLNNSRSTFGVTVAGEFSNGINDCGLFLRGVGSGDVTYGGNCADWENSVTWSDGTKAGLMKFAMASMDVLGDWFFWTWKIGNSTAGIVEAPLWSYQLGLMNGWIPVDPRTALGTCHSLGISNSDFSGTFQSWQTGGAGAGDIPASISSNFPWPPATISNAGPESQLPTYTPTGTVVALPPPTLTASATAKIDAGSGWFNTKDTGGAPTPVVGCKYPDAWDAINVALPTGCR